MAGLILRNVAKSYEATKVIESIDLEIKDGEFVVFVGPSGCGKSTLLRMIAGLEEISSGTITIGDQIVNEVAPAKRGVSMVFQTFSLNQVESENLSNGKVSQYSRLELF